MHMYVLEYMYINMFLLRREEAVVSCLTWVLGIEHTSSRPTLTLFNKVI